MGVLLAGEGKLDEARRNADAALAADPSYARARELEASLPRHGR